MAGALLMARPKSKPKQKAAEEASEAARVTVINLKGSQEQAQWFEDVHRKTHISKAMIARLAFKEWAERNGHASFPMSQDDN